MARHLITSALPYINGVKHLGNLVGSMLPSDVFARFQRAVGNEVLFICATDEHGTPAELAALEANMNVRDFCDEAHLLQKSMVDGFNLSFDHFGRTSHPHNHELTNHFGQVLAANNLIDKKMIKMLFSPSENRFLPDRYVVGTCPHCSGFAKGDQCDSCGKLLDPTELIDARSSVTGATDLEIRETASLFLKQEQMADEIRAWIETKDLDSLPKSIALKWLDEGIRDRDITRDLDWGIPVPKDLPNIGPDGLDHKVWYVWFDAPIGYMGASWEWADKTGNDWKSWWFGDAANDVHYTQFMGKDNVAFHAVSFPVTILGSREPWKTMDSLKAFNWLTYYGGKFSTSNGIGIFMDQALELLPADYWRWYLIANAPESDDTSFTWDRFASEVNADLVGNFGNFINRCLAFSAKKFQDDQGNPVIPSGGTPGEAEAQLAVEVQAKVDQIAELYDQKEARKTTRALRELWSIGNQYINNFEPWHLIKEDEEAAAMVLRTAIRLMPIFAACAHPIIPAATDKLGDMLGFKADLWPSDVAATMESLQAGQTFSRPEHLFSRISTENIENWEAKFGGESAA